MADPRDASSEATIRQDDTDSRLTYVRRTVRGNAPLSIHALIRYRRMVSYARVSAFATREPLALVWCIAISALAPGDNASFSSRSSADRFE